MCTGFKWILALVVLFVVLYGLVDDTTQKIVYRDTVAGLLVGVAHGLTELFCAIDHPRRRLTLRRAYRIFIHHVRVDTAIGLLVGVIVAIWSLWCGGGH